MAAMRKTITFTEQQDQWIKARITTGQFTKASYRLSEKADEDLNRIYEYGLLNHGL